MINNNQKEIIEKEVKSYMEALAQCMEPDCVVKLGNKEIPIYFFLYAGESQYGDWEPPFCYPLELRTELYYKVFDEYPSEERLEEFNDYVDKLAWKYSPVIITDQIFRDNFGGTMKIYTTIELKDEEWEKVKNAVAKAYWGYGNDGMFDIDWPYEIKVQNKDIDYQFWVHNPSGEVFAIRFDNDGNIDGVYGPVYYEEIKEGLLPDFDYTNEDIEWIKENYNSFNLYETKEE